MFPKTPNSPLTVWDRVKIIISFADAFLN